MGRENKRAWENGVIGGSKLSGFINTVLGTINESEVKACLCHEHICCFSEYLFKMAGKAYLDME